MRMKKIKLLILTCAALLVMTMSLGSAGTLLAAQKVETKESADWRFHDIISVDFVKDWVRLPKSDNVMLIDARPPHKYTKGHIPTAINIPFSQFDELKNQLPENKSTVLIFYCGGQK
jgi:3-mercaptopyruvate sulfurtransferase SseA